MSHDQHERGNFVQVNSDEDNQKHVGMIKRQARNSYIALGAFVLVLTLVILTRDYINYKHIQDGLFYQKHIMRKELPEEWRLSNQEMTKEQALNQKNLILGNGKRKVTRQELGRSSWTLLHMISGNFPEEISPEMIKQFNTFLVLFAKMYPCKLCANHFMDILRGEKNLFQGTTKQELMLYMCELHNKVNHRLDKPVFDCDSVEKEWDMCGCSGE